MDTNKMKNKLSNNIIKPSHFITLGYFIFIIAVMIEAYNTEGLSQAIMTAGLALFMYGVGFSMVKDLSR